MPVPTQVRRLRGRSLALSLTVAALLAATLAVGWQLVGAPAGPVELSGPWSWLPMLVFGAACAAAGLLWGRLERHAQLRQATQSQQALAELTEGWIWRSDEQHRVVSWRPPPAHRPPPGPNNCPPGSCCTPTSRWPTPCPAPVPCWRGWTRRP